MTIKQSLTAKAAELGVSLTEGSHSADHPTYEVSAVAPSGMVFACSSTHTLSHEEFSGFSGVKDRVRQAMLADLNDGLTPCGDTDCDVCERL